jgi:Zn-dependent protease
MKASVSLGRWFGVPVGLHYSWFIVAWLIALSLTGQFRAVNPAWSTATVWTLSLLTAILFFLCIVLHELAHVSVARLNHTPVRGITLFALGGISQIEKDAATPGNEFWMAIAGPAASLLIGAACHFSASLVRLAAPGVALAPAAVLEWLAFINVVLAVFNLVPGFPLDGGRVLRSIIWAITGSADAATRIAARVGQVLASLLIAGGLFAFLVRSDFSGLWIMLVGWFLLESAQMSYEHGELLSSLRGLRVADVMVHDCEALDGSLTIRAFVDDHLFRDPGRCHAVTEESRVIGLITPEDVKHISRDRWDGTTVVEAMRPLTAVPSLQPEATASDALGLLAREHMAQLPVVSNGRFEGVVTLSYLVRLLHVRQELRA